MSPHEFGSVLPEAILKRYKVISHDARDRDGLVFLGETSRHTPVWTNKVFAQAGARIVIGNIEPHQFVGFSGGVKSAVIGLGGAETIRHNHAMLTEPGCRLGEYDLNPARQDVEEIGARIGVQFALNAILNQHKQIVHVLAGSPLAVMKAGLPLSRQICQLPVSGPYDFLIVSPRGHPKDINLYQSQKGLTHAAGIMRPGGRMVLAAACSEGIGSPSYEAYMEGMTSYAQVIERFKREGFEVGPHKAFLIARDASGIHLKFISGLDPAQARAMLLPPGESLQSAIDQALADLPKNARIGILAHAASTIPYLQEEPG
jgi:nickel-dependent lactate racemase